MNCPGQVMSDIYHCWKCGTQQADLLLPLARLAECPHCRAELHVCRMCEFYDPVAPQQCREPVADAVSDKQRANFCGYFRLVSRAVPVLGDEAEASRRQLEALFGGDAPAPGSGTRSAEDLAREELEKLFGK